MAARKTTRKPARKKPVRRRPRRRSLGSRLRAFSPSKLRVADLDDSHRDALGLALVGAGLLMAFVFYFGWDGGKVGEALATGLRFLLGAVAYVIPVALILSGLALVARSDDSPHRRMKLGGAILLGSLALAYAAGSLGLGPGAAARADLFNPDFFMDRGGLIGAVEYWAVAGLFSHAGAHLFFVIGLAAGLLLTSGTSVAAVAGHLRAVAEWIGRRAQGVGDAVAGERRVANEDAVGFPYEEPDGEYRVEALDPPADEIEPDEPETAEHEVVAAAADGTEAFEDDDDAEDDLDDPLELVEREVEAVEQADLTPQGLKRSSITESEEISYRLPDPSVLRRSAAGNGPDTSNQDQVAKQLVETLGHFGIEAKLVGRVAGPRVTRHELRLAPGTKVSKITQLKDDLAYALASTDIRILAPIPGKQAVGVEVPNKRHRMVYLGDIFDRDLAQGSTKKAQAASSPLAVWLGKDISGQAIWTDLARMPHVLVAGTTGSGKSGCVNAMLSSLLLRATPNEVRLVLVDPKRVELNHYEDIPHLLTPVVTAPRMAANVLGNLISEMESRYEVMGAARARNITEMNKIRRAAGDSPLPYILCVIDELADLMMVAPAEVEDSIIRLAQKSRAVGIHLVLATQRPSVDIITGTIKVNVPARIAFAVSAQHDSRVILDGGGAESLLGQGDMLFRGAGSSKLQRIQGAYITEEEIARLTAHWRSQGEPDYEEELLEAHESPEEDDRDFSPDEDDLLEEAIRLVAQTQTASVSMVQRRLRVGYTRAGRLIDMLERRGVISGYEGSKPRQVLVSEAEVERVLASGSRVPADSQAEQPQGI
jgi:S-DNA-T family DNA segregation ATPase FtsK/SpoIIIE